MSQDPHDQLLLQMRGAVVEYERPLIVDRMRWGRQTNLRRGHSDTRIRGCLARLA